MLTINDTMFFAFLFEGYKLSDEADKASDPAITYFGYLNRDGSYYITERNTTNKTYRFVKGSSAYSTAWAARESLTYDFFDTIFK